MGFLIDTSVLIAYERGQLDLEGEFSKHPEEQVAISSITASELLQGVYRLKEGAKRLRCEVFVESCLRRLPILPFDESVARVHAKLHVELLKTGITIGVHDLMIASTAFVHGYHVITRDPRSFPKIQEIEFSVW